MSDYFSYTALSDGRTARSSLWNVVFAALDAAFNMLPTQLQLKLGITQYGVDSGVANAHVVTLPYTPASLIDGMLVKFKAVATNTGAATINVNSLGVKSITRQSGAALKPGDILINKKTWAEYNSTSGAFELVSYFADVMLQSLFDSVSALSSGSAVPISAADTSAGYAVAKLRNSDGAAFEIGTPGGNETLTIPIVPVYLTKTQAASPYTVLAVNLRANVVHDNFSATGECIFQLPAGAYGMVFSGDVQAAQYLRVKASGSETIRYLTSQSAAGGYVRANVIGKTIKLFWNGIEWVIREINGPWAMDE